MDVPLLLPLPQSPHSIWVLVCFFFQSVSGAELGWKVHKNAVECPVRLSGGKPGPVLTYISGGILWSKMQVI